LAAAAQVKSGGFSDWKRSREEPGYYLYSGRESARCKHNHHHHVTHGACATMSGTWLVAAGCTATSKRGCICPGLQMCTATMVHMRQNDKLARSTHQCCIDQSDHAEKKSNTQLRGSCNQCSQPDRQPDGCSLHHFRDDRRSK
jgi:hypothetical protein